MRNTRRVIMENNYDNTPDNNQEGKPENTVYTQYTDAGAMNQQTGSSNASGSAQPYTYQQVDQSYNGNSYQQQYQDNFNYNVNQTAYTPQNNQAQGGDTSPMSMGDWVITLLILSIPCVNIIMYLVWAFGKNGNVNRRNYCRAGLIFVAIGVVISIIVGVVFAMAIGSASSYYYY